MSAAKDRDTCPRCSKAFHCGSADAHCDCFDVALGAPLRKVIAQQYARCLCIDCLKALIEGAPITPP